jgi:hypothetical protein
MQLRERNVERVDDVALVEILAFTDVEKYAVLLVDQQGCLVRRNALALF